MRMPKILTSLTREKKSPLPLRVSICLKLFLINPLILLTMIPSRTCTCTKDLGPNVASAEIFRTAWGKHQRQSGISTILEQRRSVVVIGRLSYLGIGVLRLPWGPNSGPNGPPQGGSGGSKGGVRYNFHPCSRCVIIHLWFHRYMIGTVLSLMVPPHAPLSFWGDLYIYLCIYKSFLKERRR